MHKNKTIYFFFSLAVIMLACVIYSCSADADGEGFSTPESRELMIPDEFKEVGIKHNEGLDAAFLVLRQHYQARTRVIGNDTLKISKGAVASILTNGLKKFYVEKGYDSSAVDKYFWRKSSVKTRIANVESSPAYGYLGKINAILTEGDMTPEQLLVKLNALNREAKQCLPEEDAAAVYAGTATCYYSYIYWSENYMKWYIALKKPELLIRFNDDFLNAFVVRKGRLVPPVTTRSGGFIDKASEMIDDIGDFIDENKDDIVDADVEGAVTGAIVGAIIDGVSGAGSAAKEGAISSSVGEIVDKILN